MLATLVVNQTVLRPFHVALFIADRFSLGQTFWHGLLANTPDPPSGNALAALAIRTYIENSLTTVGPEEGMKRISGVLLNEGSTWTTLGLQTFTEERIGQELTAQLKAELIFAMNTYAAVWLTTLRDQLDAELNPEPEPEGS
jgi:hypothetical protein